MDGSTDRTAPHAIPGYAAVVVGVGTDLVEVERIRAALDRRDGLRQRLFTADEWDYAARHRDPMPHLAARFAAKESVMKALGHGMDHMAFSEIEVTRDVHGRPSVQLTGRAARVAAEVGVAGWQLSLTHTASLAQAVAVALGGGTVGEAGVGGAEAAEAVVGGAEAGAGDPR